MNSCENMAQISFLQSPNNCPCKSWHGPSRPNMFSFWSLGRSLAAGGMQKLDRKEEEETLPLLLLPFPWNLEEDLLPSSLCSSGTACMQRAARGKPLSEERRRRLLMQTTTNMDFPPPLYSTTLLWKEELAWQNGEGRKGAFAFKLPPSPFSCKGSFFLPLPSLSSFCNYFILVLLLFILFVPAKERKGRDKGERWQRERKSPRKKPTFWAKPNLVARCTSLPLNLHFP